MENSMIEEAIADTISMEYGFFNCSEETEEDFYEMDDGA
mgnify:CR=1 FL=1